MTESITFKLPYPSLTKLGENEPPTARYVCKIKQELAANAGHVKTSLSGGDNGHLGMILTNAEYAALPGPPAPFVMPALPGAPVIAGGVKAREQARADHKHAVKIYSTAMELQGQLKALIIEAVPIVYFGDLHHAL